MDDHGEGSSASGRDEPAPDSKDNKSSKTKLKRRSAQKRSRFQITLRRRSESPDVVDDVGDDGDDEHESREQTPDSTTENAARQDSTSEAQTPSTEVESTGEKHAEIVAVSTDEGSVDPQQRSPTPPEVDYDDYSTHQHSLHSHAHPDPETVGYDSANTWYSFGASVSGYLGQFTTQAWSLAKTTWQTYQDYLLASDSDDDWGESREDSSSDDETNFEDAAEELVPRDRLHHICHELMETEEQYVKRLKILVNVKAKTAKILKPDLAKVMFQDVEVICQFHQDNLLPQLKERLQYWEKYRRVGDIMKKFSPFLKLYTEYVKNFKKATTLVDQYEEKSSAFAAMLKEVRDSGEGGKLKVQAHMMEPVQRVPRYVLLLKDYEKRLPDDSPDREDTQKALELVGAAACHFESMIKRDSRLSQLMQVQSQMDGSVSIVNCKRELLKQGKIFTVSARTAKPTERYLFLFNDMLLVCNEQSILGTKYKLKHNIDLGEAQTADGNNLELPNTFYVRSTYHVVEFHCSSGVEKESWYSSVTRQIGECTKTKLLKKGSRRVRESQMSPQSLGKRAPVLVKHNEVTMCMICASEFSALRRKRNCRACGVVICGKCSSHAVALEYDRAKSSRVCDECFVIMQDQDGASAKNQTNRDSKGKRTEGECIHKGNLQLSSDVGKTWKKRWFAVHESGHLYSFKAPQDISPLTSLFLKGFRYQLVHNDQKKCKVLELSGAAKKYYFLDEADGLQGWIDVLSKMVKPAEDSDKPDDELPSTADEKEKEEVSSSS